MWCRWGLGWSSTAEDVREGAMLLPAYHVIAAMLTQAGRQAHEQVVTLG
jgi:urease accessory protein UreE